MNNDRGFFGQLHKLAVDVERDVKEITNDFKERSRENPEEIQHAAHLTLGKMEKEISNLHSEMQGNLKSLKEAGGSFSELVDVGTALIKKCQWNFNSIEKHLLNYGYNPPVKNQIENDMPKNTEQKEGNNTGEEEKIETTKRIDVDSDYSPKLEDFGLSSNVLKKYQRGPKGEAVVSSSSNQSYLSNSSLETPIPKDFDIRGLIVTPSVFNDKVPVTPGNFAEPNNPMNEGEPECYPTKLNFAEENNSATPERPIPLTPGVCVVDKPQWKASSMPGGNPGKDVGKATQINMASRVDIECSPKLEEFGLSPNFLKKYEKKFDSSSIETNLTKYVTQTPLTAMRSHQSAGPCLPAAFDISRVLVTPGFCNGGSDDSTPQSMKSMVLQREGRSPISSPEPPIPITPGIWRNSEPMENQYRNEDMTQPLPFDPQGDTPSPPEMTCSLNRHLIADSSRGTTSRIESMKQSDYPDPSPPKPIIQAQTLREIEKPASCLQTSSVVPPTPSPPKLIGKYNFMKGDRSMKYTGKENY